MIYFFLLINHFRIFFFFVDYVKKLAAEKKTKKTAAQFNIAEMCSFPRQTEDEKKQNTKNKKQKHPHDANFSHMLIL